MKLRILSIAAFAALAALVIGAAPARAEALLRPAVTVEGDTIKLGDIFDNAGAAAQTVVARAPAPGHRLRVDAEWLQHVATLNGLDWHTDNPFLELIIQRTGLAIPGDRIRQEILAALVAQGVPAQSQIEFANRDLGLIVPSTVAPTVAVTDLHYDPATSSFTALIEAPAGDPQAERISVAGRVVEAVEVPVPSHPMGRGDVIAARDLSFIQVRKDTLRRDVITDVDQIIGMTPRGSLRTGQAIALADLQRPVVVPRGALVTIVMQQGGMQLTTQGRALEPGSLGDIIRVANTRSNLVVPAHVDGPNRVSVGLGTAPLPAQSAAQMPAGGVALAN